MQRISHFEKTSWLFLILTTTELSGIRNNLSVYTVMKQLKDKFPCYMYCIFREQVWTFRMTQDILTHAVEKHVLTAFTLCKKASNHHAKSTPRNVQFYIVTTWETPGNHWCWWPDTLIIALVRVIIKVSGHQHQWFPGVSQVVTM